MPSSNYNGTTRPEDVADGLSDRQLGNTCGGQLYRSVTRMGMFWSAIMVATLGLCVADAISRQPALVHSSRGLVMGALVLAYVAWSAYIMRFRQLRKLWQGWREGSERQRYVIILAGLLLSAALLALSPSFFGLLFIIVGITASAFEPRKSLVPMAAAILVFAIGDFETSRNSVLLNFLFLAMTIGIAYSISALNRERCERERLFVELQEAHQRLRLSAAQEADLAALRERNRLAREMHDSLGHALVLIVIKIEAAQRLQAVDPARAEAEWEDTKALVRTAMAELRSSLAGMRPPALEDQPFREALAGMASDLGKRAGIDVSCNVDEEAAAIDRSTQEALYRVAQEALTNVAKHARATHASLDLHLIDGTAELEIGDDGVGLAAARRNDGHYGVTGMRERIEALGGVLTLDPQSGGGTLVRTRVPLPEHAEGLRQREYAGRH